MRIHVKLIFWTSFTSKSFLSPISNEIQLYYHLTSEPKQVRQAVSNNYCFLQGLLLIVSILPLSGH